MCVCKWCTLLAACVRVHCVSNTHLSFCMIVCPGASLSACTVPLTFLDSVSPIFCQTFNQFCVSCYFVRVSGMVSVYMHGSVLTTHDVTFDVQGSCSPVCSPAPRSWLCVCRKPTWNVYVCVCASVCFPMVYTTDFGSVCSHADCVYTPFSTALRRYSSPPIPLTHLKWRVQSFVFQLAPHVSAVSM